MPLLFGEEQDPGKRVFRAGQAAQRVLLLFPETRARIRTEECGRRCRAPRHQSATVAVRHPPKPGDTDRRSAVHGQRVEVV